ncbi:Peptidase family M48 [Amycolatopsis xylanica]|uniref:Peptidase family M48 n=1 Tax=Amycolatopsis xylanica TaxID=589385 RepID=A0A1H3SER5_9PSEU|nr:M48 family metalloprotease [Amycolatopsis xylanica]SDZ36482.1 Peptidase family M48 [Amycolatopsis xylanica]
MTTTDVRVETAPSAGRGRYALLIVVLLLAGVLVGSLLHSQFLGRSWVEAIQACGKTRPLATAADTPAQSLEKSQQWLDCVTPVERRRGLVSLSGALLVLLLALGLTQLLPRRLFRRAGPVSVAPAVWQERAENAVRSMRRRVAAPQVVFGSLALREAFTIRFLRWTRMVLPPGIVTVPPDQADAIVRHESAHVAAGDVGLVWLTRGVWWALPPVLALPLLTTEALVLFAGNTHTLWESFWAEYVGRAALVLVLTALVSTSVLRSREHEADLRSVREVPSAPLRALLSRATTAARAPWWRRANAIHPPPSQRVAVLDAGELPGQTRVLDGVVYGALAAMAAQTTTLVALPTLLGSAENSQSYALPLSCLLAGALTAAGWGTALWRFALGTQRSALRWAGVTLGLPVGVALGFLTDFSRTGTTDLGPFGDWPQVVALAVAMAGAACVSLALASLWATTAPRRIWVLAAVLNTALFTGAWWIGMTSGALIIAAQNWFYGVAIAGMSANWQLPVAIGLVVVCGLAWHWNSGRLTLLAVSATATAAALLGRWLLPEHANFADPKALDRLDWWVAVGAATACLLALAALNGRTGLGQALAAAPTAALLTTAGCLLMRNRSRDLDLVSYLVSVPSLFTLVLLCVAVPITLLPGGWPRTRAWHSPALALVAASGITTVVMRIGHTIT